MTLQQLACFCTTAHEGSFSAAARRLRLSQPSTTNCWSPSVALRRAIRIDAMRGIRERLERDVVVGAEGYLFELERRGYLKAGAFVPGGGPRLSRCGA